MSLQYVIMVIIAIAKPAYVNPNVLRIRLLNSPKTQFKLIPQFVIVTVVLVVKGVRNKVFV